MDTDVLWGAFCACILAVVFVLGWIVAHDTVATECKKLGAFYIGTEVYECKVKPK